MQKMTSDWGWLKAEQPRSAIVHYPGSGLRLGSMESEALHHRRIGNAQQDRVVSRFMEVRPPRRRSHHVAARPFEALAVDRGRAAAAHHREDVVGGGAMDRRARAWR